MFVLKVNKSAIRVLESESIYGDSKNIYNVVLLFNEDWNGLTKVITFDNGTISKPVIADATRTIITTTIPWELLTYPGTIRISVSGARNNLVVLPTQFCILGKIKQGSTTEYPPESENPSPSPSAVDQLMSLIAQKGDTIELLDGTLYLKSDGKVISQAEIQNGSSEPISDSISILEDATINNKSFFDNPVNQTYLFRRVVIEYLNKENLIEEMEFANDVVQIVSDDSRLNIYTIEGKVIKFLYSDDGTIIFGSVEFSTTGSDGASAYEIAVEQGFVGTEQEWLDSLKGAPGKDGEDGKSAYQLAVEEGFEGSLEDWLASLNGVDGLTTYDIAVNNGYSGSEEDWLNSLHGSSAYEIALSNGYEGTEEEWLRSLKGAKGTKGDPGKSAYQIAEANGFEGTENEWLESLKGKSAYDIAVENGFEGTEEEWISSAGGGTSDHTKLTNRDAENQHPISAIDGLQEQLDKFQTEKVDKVEGKGLSTNDFTDDDKTKLESISLDGIPVKPVTQGEYDGLSEEEKNEDVMYLVTDASGSSSGPNVGSSDIYSTEEIRIGTWIDGKPIYRKVIYGETGANDVFKTIITADFVDIFVTLRGIITAANGSQFPIPNFYSDEYRSGITFGGSKNISVWVSNVAHANRPVAIILEYTKTTDFLEEVTE